ncbi:Pimeloyl-ACP methyl ester carboxylesterase [Polynucleobacter meluiroseus]|uniref:Pimeloyl-ACP methyl ester carboxylesterase n=1 Tax=Polynucleobacter meluiroseus TaxID=1938814 RepID=A0A240E041_9BURK|nr:alpha/beta fold hydrolase [Polynucleobacter meluiroseus]SNX28577.1 Pimeloyl-ACP methyl ester carboxylesterase [Polynucleobacter meluiroseus]
MMKSVLERLLGIRPATPKSSSRNDISFESIEQVRVDPTGPIEKEDILPSSPVELQQLDDPISIDAPITIQPETRFFQLSNAGHARKVAYTVSGNPNAVKVLVCLPGLLETKASFLELHNYFLNFSECLVVSIDVSGRGESDHIGAYGEYKMSMYLQEIEGLIKNTILTKKDRSVQLTVLGTSMGGVLAMYLTKTFPKNIVGIVLNDIALTVNWTSLYSLYKSMKNGIGFKAARQVAVELSVDERAIADVQRPGHFDLSYRADIWGMNFHEALEGFKGKVGLIYGSQSEICTEERVDEAKIYLPTLDTCKIEGAGHPAPFNVKACHFIQSQMAVVS